MSSELLSVLTSRGFVHQCTDYSALEDLLEQEQITAYIGFDATAPSLHAGNLIQLMMLRWLQDTGHRPLVVIGGGTSQIGDPSGRDKQRTLLAPADIAANLSGIRQVFGQFLHQPEIIDNARWLEDLGHLAFLRDVAKHFTVNRMLTFEMVRSRLELQQSLSFLEFSYMLLQAYDFLELYRRYGCRLQLGGADQWGNIVSGIELARRVEGAELYGLTSPLLTTASGLKMGKSVAGAVWLRKDWLSPYDYWQFWRNTQDQDVGRFLRLFTQLPLDEIVRLEHLQGAELNQAKKILADEATTLCHGAEQSQLASKLAEHLFEHKSTGEQVGLPSADLPSIEITQAEIDKGLTLAGVLHRAGLASSKSAARRLIQGAGVQIKTDQLWQHLQADTSAQDCILLAGKKRYLRVRVAN